MPIKSKPNIHSFSESYYRNKFVVKQQELFILLESKPDDLVAKKQMEFISEVLRRGDENNKWGEYFDWLATWQNWERGN